MKTGNLVALLSFIGGTIIMLLYFLTGMIEVGMIGYFYIVVVGIINIVIALRLIIKAIKFKEDKSQYLKTVGLMLCNIPVLILYLYFVEVLVDIARVTIVNETGKIISEIKIGGCEERKINDLNPNDSETIWVKINGDCYMDIHYKLDGKNEYKMIYSYLTNSDGFVGTFRIGKNGDKYE